MSENIEKVKLSLHNAKQIEDIKNNPSVKVTILSFFKTIPFFGELIDSTIDIILLHFQEQKRNELLNIIISNSEQITSEMVNDVEFIMNFAKTLEAVNRLATNDKVVYFGNLLKNSYLVENKIVNDEYEEYLTLLNELSYREIYILIRYSKIFENIDEEEFKGGFMEKPLFQSFLNEITSDFCITQGELGDIMAKLQNKGLCVFYGGNPLSEMSNTILTDYSKKFLARIGNVQGLENG